jgi:hypothetical protein
MDRIIDLDAAAAEIDRRRPSWQATGLQPGPTTWRDTDSWPQRIQPERDKAVDPDSVGVRVNASDKGGMEITLFRNGWADLTVVVYHHEGDPVIEAPEITTPEAFGAVLDHAISTLLRWLA